MGKRCAISQAGKSWGFQFSIIDVFAEEGTTIQNLVAAASYDETVKIWDLRTTPEARVLPCKSGFGLSCVAFRPNGRQVAVADDSIHYEGRRDDPAGPVHFFYNRKAFTVWDAVTGKNVHTVQLEGKLSTRQIAYSSSGDRLISVSSWNDAPTDPECEVRLWDAQDCKELFTLRRPPTHGLQSVAFSPDGRRFAFGGAVNVVEICDAATGEQVLTIEARALSLAFSPCGRWLATASGSYREGMGETKIWDAVTGKEVRTLRVHRHEFVTIKSLAFSRDGRNLATASGNTPVNMDAVTVWEVETGKDLWTLRGHANEVTTIAFSPDGKRLVSGSRDQTVKLWDMTIGQHILTLRGHTQDVTCVAFSANGKLIASAGGDGVRIWDARPLAEQAFER